MTKLRYIPKKALDEMPGIKPNSEYRAVENMIVLVDKDPNTTPIALAHELAHRRLGHKYREDVYLAFKGEVDAWRLAKESGWAYDPDYAKRSLQTYLKEVGTLYGDDDLRSARQYALEQLGLRV